MWRAVLLFLVFCMQCGSATVLKRGHQSVWTADRFQSLLAFGDSYTDENRLTYFGINNGSAPPPGTYLPESFSTAGGGRTWARYVVQYTGTEVNSKFMPQITLYDYAVSGAVCSNSISPRTDVGIHADFPSVLEYELPAFLSDKTALRNGTNIPYFTPPLMADDALYAMWIGTNDVGVYAFLTDSQVPGKTLTSYSDCVFQALDGLYAAGGRSFVLLNLAPLDLAPLYANLSQMGAGPNHYWPEKPSNITAVSEQMKEYVTTLNNVYKYQTAYEKLVSGRYPEANFALFDVHSLLTDIYNNPTLYLNGSAPANVTGFEKHCDITGMICSEIDEESADSFLWYDELHPSEQTDRVIAKNFVEVMNGESKYATYY